MIHRVAGLDMSHRHSKPRKTVPLKLTEKQAAFLRRLLQTHADVCTLETADLCSAILKKLRPTSTKARNSNG